LWKEVRSRNESESERRGARRDRRRRRRRRRGRRRRIEMDRNRATCSVCELEKERRKTISHGIKHAWLSIYGSKASLDVVVLVVVWFFSIPFERIVLA
jgi:hypothetical protein